MFWNRLRKQWHFAAFQIHFDLPRESGQEHLRVGRELAGGTACGNDPMLWDGWKFSITGKMDSYCSFFLFSVLPFIPSWCELGQFKPLGSMGIVIPRTMLGNARHWLGSYSSQVALHLVRSRPRSHGSWDELEEKRKFLSEKKSFCLLYKSSSHPTALLENIGGMEIIIATMQRAIITPRQSVPSPLPSPHSQFGIRSKLSSLTRSSGKLKTNISNLQAWRIRNICIYPSLIFLWYHF